MGANTVVNKIYEKSAAECDAIAAASKEKAASLKSSIIADAKLKADEIVKLAEEKANLEMMRGKQASTLGKRIGTLDYKHELLNSVKEEVTAKVLSLDIEAKAKLYTKLVESNAMTGKVTVSVPEKEVSLYKDGKLLKYWSESITEKTGKNTEMVLSDANADIEGGLILCGDIFDIDLSVESLVKEIFEQNEKSIADKLFGEGANV